MANEDAVVGFLQNNTNHSAEMVRRALWLPMSGLTSATGSGSGGKGGVPMHQDGDMLVKENGTPNNSVLVDPGHFYIDGGESSVQGKYYCRLTSQETLSIADKSAFLRHDLIVAYLRDQSYSGTDNDWVIGVVQGLAASTDPTITYNNYLVIARVRVASGSGAPTVQNADIDDMRKGLFWRVTPPAAYAYHNTTQSFNHGSSKNVELNTELYDYDDMHSVVCIDPYTNCLSSRMYANTNGLYLLSARLGWSGYQNNMRTINYIQSIAGGTHTLGRDDDYEGDNHYHFNEVTLVAHTDDIGDYAFTTGYQSNSTTGARTVLANQENASFSATWIGE